VGMTIYAFYAPYFFLNMILPHGTPAASWVRGAANLLASVLIGTFQACAYAVLHRRLEETA